MNQIKISCPHCGQHISAPREVVGQTVECPTCHREFPAVIDPPHQINTGADFTSSSAPLTESPGLQTSQPVPVPPAKQTLIDEQGNLGPSKDPQESPAQETTQQKRHSGSRQKGRFKPSGIQIIIFCFVVSQLGPHLFDDFEEFSKFTLYILLAAGVAFFIYKQIFSESFIEGGDSHRIRVPTENRSLFIALGSAIAVTVAIDIIFNLQEEKEIDLRFLSSEILQILIWIVLTFYFAVFVVKIHNKNILGQGIRVTQSQIPDLHDSATIVAERLQIPVPEIFVIHNDEINAYAVGFKDSYTVVIHSKVLEELDDDEVKFILGHEFTHIKFRHTFWSALIGETGVRIPVLSWILSFFFLKWSRDAEYTCDRGGLLACQKKEAAISALKILMAGSKVGRTITIEGIRQQSEEFRSGKVFKNTESLSTHPFTANRITAIEDCDLMG